MQKQRNIFSFVLGTAFAVAIFVPFFTVLADNINVSASVPAICGNSVIEGAETCDDGNVVSGDGCSNICITEGGGGDGGHNDGGGGAPAPAPAPFVCGDGVVNGVDECDDGNADNDDACSNACRLPICGDGHQAGAEQCDDGNFNDDDNCSVRCTLPVCGDGQAQGGEQCDDGNFLNNDGCSAVCIVEIPAVCGNAVREGLEQCDDGNAFDRDGCSAICVLDPAPICGNALIEWGELCDDGNIVEHDGCSLMCFPEVIPRCGNRLLEFGEQCDDGNLAGGDGCSIACQLEPAPVCGNGRKERGEVCDDGNQNDDDACNHLCQFVPLAGTVCGNSVREVGEQCDDGNLHGGDGCSGACQNENPDQVNPVQDPQDGNNAQAPGQDPDPDAPVIPNPDQVNPNNQNGDNGEAPEDNNQGQNPESASSSVFAPVFEVPKPTIISVLLGVDKKAPITKQVSIIVKNATKNIASTAKFFAAEAKVVAILAKEAADNPKVEEATKTVVAPASVAVVVAAVAPSMASVAIPLLRFLFLQPLLLFGRKKREEWGQIYNTLTKLPIDLAMIRLIDPKTKRIVQSRVTDARGRYLFIVDPGEYLLEVTKPGFQFPSVLLQGVKSDGKLLDIYHGETIQVSAAGIGITPNIPLDPIGANKTPRRIIWEKRWLVVQHAISLLGILLTGLGIYITPVWYMWIFLAVHISAYIGFMRFVKPKKPSGWGLVSEKESASPIGNTIVRLFTKQYNKLVSTQVTDKEGRYAFLVGPSEYYVTYEKKGYKQYTTDSFQIAEDAKGSVVKEKVSLEKEK